ncbi:hypothetical protein N9X37_05120 [Planktomarina temperata]|nr:hypothetical protein [Planktomarina temperata]
MTIQQHASFDSSAAELNATSKLVKAWESKNAKNAAKAGGVSLMALSLAACGGSDDVAVDITSDNAEILLAAVTAVDATATTVAEVASNANAAGVTAGETAADAAIRQSVADAGITVAADATSAEMIAAVAASDNESVAATAKTAALTNAAGTKTYTTVDAAYDEGVLVTSADAVTAALTDADGTPHASVDVAITSNDTEIANAATTAANATAEATLVAGTGFDTVAALNAAYTAAIAATPILDDAFGTTAAIFQGTVGDDVMTATSATYLSGQKLIDATSSDSDTLTVTATDDIANVPLIAGFENVVFNLNASSTTTGTATEFDVDVANISQANITVAVTKPVTTVTTVAVTNLGDGNTLTTGHNLTVTAVADADVALTMTKATTQTVTQNGASDNLTINSSAATTLTVVDAFAEEAIAITGAGAVTITDLSAATTSATKQSLDVDAAGTITLTKSTNDGTVDLNTTSGNVVVTLANVATGAFDLTTAAGDITVTDADGSTATLTASATGDADANVTGADGDISVVSGDAFTGAVLTASGGIAVTGLDAVTTMSLSAGQASTLEDVGAVTALTLAGTSATGVTYTVKTNENDLNAVDTITFAGTGDVTLAVDGTDLVVAAASTAGGTTAASVIATDNSTGESRIKLQEAAGADLDLSALAVDFVEFGHNESSTDKYKLASGQKIAIGSDTAALVLDAAAVAGNTATVVVEDDAAAVDATAHLLTKITSTNIGELTIQHDDTEQALVGTDGVDATAGTADDVGVVAIVGAANVLKTAGAGDIEFSSVTAASFDGSASTGAIDFKLINTAVKTVKTGAGDDTFTGDGTAAAYKLDGGDGTDTFVMADTEDYSALAFTITNVEKIDVSATADFAGTLASSQITGQSILVQGDSASADVLNIALTATGEVSNLAGIDVVLANVAVAGSAGGDTIVGSANGVMTIDGNGGVDNITGGSAADILIGGAGLDVITTGGGRDTVTIETEATLVLMGNTADTVKDFTAGALGDKYNYDGATAGVTAITGTAFDGSTAATFQTHSVSGNLTVTATAGIVNITVEDASSLSSDGVSVLDALKTGSAAGTITMDTSGDIALFAISDGTNTGIYLGDSDGDASLTFNEMVLITTLEGVDNADLTVANFI